MPGGSLFLEAGKDGKRLFEEAESKDAVGDVFTSLLSGNGRPIAGGSYDAIKYVVVAG